MNPTEEWARAEAVNVVAAIRGLGKDPAEWPVGHLSDLERLVLMAVVFRMMPPGQVEIKGDTMIVSGWQAAPPPDEPKRIQWREFL